MFCEIPLVLVLWMLLVLEIVHHRHASTGSIDTAVLAMLSPLLEHAV